MSFLDYNFRTDIPTGNNLVRKPTTNYVGPARVIDVILDDDHELYKVYGGPSAMGAIFYRKLNSISDTSETKEEQPDGIAFPINAHTSNIPLKNEVVMLIKGPGQDIASTKGDTRTYYNTVVSIWNNPHHGATPGDNASETVDLGGGIDEEGTLAPLQQLPGDIAYQGRLGQSIRFTGGLSKKSPWTDETNKNKPLIIISNGQIETKEGFTPIFENINEDASSIYFTSNHIIPLLLANDKRTSYNTAPDLPSSYKGAQLLFNSDRVTINSKKSDVLISSAESVGINGTSVNIDSTDYLCLDADKMFFGELARINEGAAKQPIVLGHRMEQFLQDILDQMISLANALGAAKTIKGDKIPVVNKEGVLTANVLKEKRNELNPKGSSSLKSKKIFVE